MQGLFDAQTKHLQRLPFSRIERLAPDKNATRKWVWQKKAIPTIKPFGSGRGKRKGKNGTASNPGNMGYTQFHFLSRAAWTIRGYP
jgi:hypothetical protein